MKKLDFLPNLKNKYSIRKFTVGTASILIGSLLFLGHDGDAQAAEDTNNDSVAEVSADNSETQQSSQEIEKVTTETTPQDVSEDKVESPLEKDKSQEASQVENQPTSDEEVSSSAKEPEKAASKELSSDKKDEVQSSNNTKVQQEQSVSKETIQPETESKPKEDTIITEKKATDSSQPVQKEETDQVASQEDKVVEPVKSNKFETLTTEQKVEKVKAELGSEHEEAAINEALGKIDAENLSSEQIKGEILKLLVKQGSAQRDLYSPQATLNNSEENEPKYAVRAFQVDTSAKDQVVVTKDNFNDYFWTIDDASYDEKTGIATLTPDEPSKKGAISLDTKLNINKDFHFSGAINLGDKGEGHKKDGVIAGGDGIGFMFNPGKVHDLGLYGAGLGFGGLPFSFGFKFDTFVNTGYDRNGKAQQDPVQFNNKGAFGAFVYANGGGDVITQQGSGTFKAELLKEQPQDNKFVDLTIDYDADTQVMTINYGGQEWSQKMTSYFNYTKKKVYALAIGASTGGAHNLQQVRIDKFTYTASALLEEDYVDQDTQELIGTPLRTSGDIDEVITLIERPDYLTKKGYELVSKDTRLAPDYNSANNSVKLTNASQFIVYTVKDIEAPKIEDIANVSSNVSEVINPIKLNITDNSGHFKSKTVTGLPEGLTFNETTNEITGTPTKIGTSTVTITATDNANLSTTKTFTYTVADAVAPEITAVENKTSEAYTPITPISLTATDNSGAVPTLEVTGLPAGLSYDDKTKQITGTPTAVGQSEVTIKATDAANNSSTTKFSFTVEANKALEALKQAVQEAKGLDKTPYTPDSVQALNNKVAEGDQLVAHPENGSSDLFKQKTDEINQAKAQLSTEADKTELNKAIEKAGTLGQLNDADKEDKAVKDKLTTANEVKANKNATKDQVDAATNDLNTAINDKLYHDALDRLNAAINDAKTVNQSEYTPSTVAPFSKALTDGEAKAADKTATPDQLDKAAKAITDAKAQLQHAADKQALEAAINKAKALGALNEADKEDKGVKDALTSGETVKNNNNASQQQVADATKALNDAIEAKEHADALDALKAKLAEVAGLDKATYTPNTVTPLNLKEEAGKAVVAAEKSKTTDEIKAATEALTNAQNGLVKKANKADLEKAITKAEGFTQLNPQKPMDKQLQDALTAAKAVDADDNATQQATDTNKDQLNEAILEKERADAFERLQAAVAKGAQVASSEGFTPDSVQKVKDVIQEVNPLVMASMSDDPAEKGKYDVAAIDAATQKINDSVDALVKKADKTELQKAIDRAGTLGALEAADKEDKAVQDKLTAANQVKDNGNATPQEVTNATNELNQAIDQKLYQDALDELNAAIKDGEGLDKTAYTPDSVTPFEASINAGKTKAADKNATPDQLKAATQAIKDAKDALKQKANKDGLNNSITAAEALQPLQPGNLLDDAVKNALDKAKAVQGNDNAAQPAVDAAKTELDNAVNAKKAQDAKDAAAKQAALDELKAELAKVAKIDKNNFTPDTVTPLTEKEAAGQAIVNAPQDKTVEEIKEATKALQDAEKALQAKSDKAALQAAIDKAEAIKDLNPADVEDKAVQDKLAEAKAVKNNDNASQQAVQDATKALNDAVAAKEHADALDALKAELKKVEGLNKDTYTPDSVTPLTEKETEGKAIVAAPDTKSTDEIKKATDALKAAEAGLVNKANKEELQKAIDKADALKGLDAADKEDKAVQDKLAEAKTVKANDNATPEQVQNATKALNDAVAAKERQDALDELQKALDDAAKVKQEDYKPNTVAPFEAAIKAGETAKADTAKTPAELKEAAKAINDAKNALQAKANKDGLNTSIQTAEGLQPLVTGDAEDDAVKAALEKAKTVQANQNADQPAVDAAKAELDNAIKAKQDQDAKEKADAAKAKEDALKELQAELEKVAKIDKNKYTPDSVTPLTEKQSAGQAIVDAPAAKTTEEIKAATQALKDAEKALQPKSDKAALEAAIDKAIALGDLDENDKEDKAVKDALTAGQVVDGDGNATPEQVQNATKALNDALAAKERQDALDELQKALDDAAKVKQVDYKPNTVAPFEAAIKAGETAKADAAKTPEELKAAAKAIKDAQAALQAKADKAELDKSVTAAEALQPLKAGDPEDDAVKTALEKAKEVQANQNADQPTVDAAKEALDNAVNAKKAADAKEAAEAADAAKAKENALDELKAELAKVEKLNKDDYTPNTVNPLNEKETAGKGIVANPDDKTADEIKAATDALKAAEAGLVNKANKEELQKAIDKAEALKDLDAADTEDKAVQDKLAEAQTVKANDNATPEQVQAATQALNDAVAAKERQDALDELQKALDAANAINKDAYTPNSVAPLDSAVKAGETAKADAAKTPEELKEAAKAIKDAQAALQAKADKAELDKAVTTAEGLGNLDPADAEDKAVKDALDKAKEVQANQNADQPTVDAAKEALNKAIDAKKAADAKEQAEVAKAKEDALKELQAELDKVAKIDKNNFTPDTVTPLTNKEDEGKAIIAAPDAKSTEEIKAATQALKDAENALQAKSDKAALQAAIDKAEALKDLDAADTEDKAVQDKLAEAQTVKANDNATPEQVQNATKALNDALAAKERQDALDELQKALDAANAVNKEAYTPNSVAPLDGAVKAGETAKADATKTPEELKAAAKAINDAKDALQAKADKAELDKAVTTAEGLGNLDPADAEDKAVQDALNKAKEVQADQNADQPAVDAAKEALNKAIDAKKAADTKEQVDAAKAKQDALDALKAELAKVKALDKDTFTPNTVAPLNEKEAAGDAAVADADNKSIDEIKEATQALKDAETGLVKRADKGDLEKAIDKAEALGQLDPADAEDKAVQDAVIAGQTVKDNANATPEQVAKATKDINDAVAAKERQDALDELNKAIDAANALDKDTFTPETVSPLEDAVKDGEAIRNDLTKRPEELKDAALEIQEAIKALHAKANKDGLNNSIQTAEGLGNLNPADAEDKAVQDALDKAKEVQADQNANQTAVDKAKEDLDNAIKAKQDQDAKEKADTAKAKQDALDALKAELAKVKALDKDAYTPDTVTPLNEKETAGDAVVANADNKSIDEIKDATQALKDAEAGLVKRADKGDLEKAIEKANALGQLDAADAEDKAVKDAVTAGQTVKDNANATPEQVAKATKDINDAVAAKERQDALDELNKAIDAAQNIEKADYTAQSVEPLDKAKEAGQKLAADNQATPEQLKEAAKLINDAINQLVPDKAELAKQIEAAKAFEPLNDTATDQLLKHALDAAVAVQNNPNATPQEIKEATWNLEDEIANKIAADAIEALKNAVNKANALKEEKYTPNSYAPLKTATTEGQSILDDPSSADVPTTLAKAKEINQLIDALKEKADKTALETALDKAVAFENLDDKDAEDKAVHDALLAGQEVEGDLNATPEEVQKATEDLNNALAAKEHADALDELNKALEAAKAVTKDNFTPDSVKPLEEAVKAGETTQADAANKTPDELKEAAKAINDAKDALKAKADKDGLNTSIQTAEGLGNLDPADAEDKAVKDALDKAKAVQANQNADQPTVDAAKAELDNASKAKQDQDAKEKAEAAKAKLDALDALKAELEKVAQINKDNFTPASVTPLTNKEDEGKAIVAAPDAKSTEEIKAATQALKDAEKALQAKSDKAALQAAINKAETLKDLNPADTEDKAVQDKLAEAHTVKSDDNATPEQVQEATQALNDALAAKEHADALDELNKAIDAANAVAKDSFTPDSVKPLEEAVKAGETVKADAANKTPEELKAAAKVINDAKDALKAKADKGGLNTSIQTAEGLGNLDSADAEDKAVKDALDKAKAVQADQNADQTAVDKAKAELDNAIKVKQDQDAKEKADAAKAKQDALDALKAELAKVEKLNKDDFTPNSVAPLNEKETAGKAIVADADNKSIDEIKEATQALKDAENALVKRADKSELDKAVIAAEGLGDLDTADSEDKAVKDALDKAKEVQANLNATQAEVDEAKDALNKAIQAKADQDKADAVNTALEALKAELEKAKAVNEDNYTPNSVKPLAEAANTGQAIVDAPTSKTVEEINKAAQAVKDALADLQAKANKAELEKAIEKAENINSFDPGDAEDAAVLEALSNAKEVEADANATQAEVDAAKDALNKAIQAKANQDKADQAQADAVNSALDALKAELEKAKAVNKDNYTPNSVKPLTEAANTGQAIVDVPTGKTVEEINKATQAVKDALAGLQAKADKTELGKAIEKAESINSFDPGDAEDAAVLEALSNAKEVEADANATQAEVDAAKDALNKAIQAKADQDKADRAQADAVNTALDALKAELEKAKAANKDNYTPNSVKPLTEAANTGQAIVDAPTGKTVEEINKAAQAVKDALAGLQAKADKAELGKSIEKAESINSFDPGDAEDAAVLEALSNAKEVEADANATQAEVDAAKDALNKAIQAKADQDKADALAELQKALDKAKATDKTNCTPESVKNLDDAINKGQEVVNHSNEVSIDSIKAAEKAIQDALKALEVDKASDSGKDTENVKRPTVKAVEKTSDKVNKKSEGSKAETKAKSKELPKTGLESPVDPKYATLMFAIGGLMALFGRRKKEDKDSTEK